MSGYQNPRIAAHDEASGQTIDLSRADALRLLRRDPVVRANYVKNVRRAGQWLSPPDQRGRLILIGELAQRVLREIVTPSDLEPFDDLPGSSNGRHPENRQNGST